MDSEEDRKFRNRLQTFKAKNGLSYRDISYIEWCHFVNKNQIQEHQWRTFGWSHAIVRTDTNLPWTADNMAIKKLPPRVSQPATYGRGGTVRIITIAEWIRELTKPER